MSKEFENQIKYHRGIPVRPFLDIYYLHTEERGCFRGNSSIVVGYKRIFFQFLKNVHLVLKMRIRILFLRNTGTKPKYTRNISYQELDRRTHVQRFMSAAEELV